MPEDNTKDKQYRRYEKSAATDEGLPAKASQTTVEKPLRPWYSVFPRHLVLDNFTRAVERNLLSRRMGKLSVLNCVSLTRSVYRDERIMIYEFIVYNVVQ